MPLSCQRKTDVGCGAAVTQNSLYTNNMGSTPVVEPRTVSHPLELEERNAGAHVNELGVDDGLLDGGPPVINKPPAGDSGDGPADDEDREVIAGRPRHPSPRPSTPV